MAQGMNRITLVGNLGADADLRQTKEGRAVLNFRIATTETYVNKTGEKTENTQWHSCVLWGNRAEAVAKYMTKGTRVLVEGRMEYRQYEDKDGNKRTAAEVNVLQLLLLGDRDDKRDDRSDSRERMASSGKPAARSNGKPASRKPVVNEDAEDAADGDEIPF